MMSGLALARDREKAEDDDRLSRDRLIPFRVPPRPGRNGAGSGLGARPEPGAWSGSRSADEPARMALLEGVSLFAVACGALLVWSVGIPWTAVGAVLAQALVISLGSVLGLYYSDLYALRAVPSLGKLATRLLRFLVIGLVALATSHALFSQSKIGQEAVTWGFVAAILLLLSLRVVAFAVARSRPSVERVLIVGAGPLAAKLVDEIEARHHLGYDIVGVADDAGSAREWMLSYPLFGPLERLGKIVEEIRPDRVIVALAERRGRAHLEQLLVARVRGVIVEDGVETYEDLTGKLAIESLTPSHLVFSDGFQVSRVSEAIRRGVSFLAAALGLVVLAPLSGLIALVIKLDSPGSPFFVQERIGKGGRRFKLIKFRTMRQADEPRSEWVRDNLDRITRVGRWLRKFRLDELPQLVNILRGDMNLVGPRPHAASHFELLALVSRNAPECGAAIPYYGLRCLVRPGLTGWAQVRYRYANNLPEEIEKLRYDLYYIKHMSLALDLQILLDTVKTVLSGRDGLDAA